MCLIDIFTISGVLIRTPKKHLKLGTGNVLNLEQFPEIITS